MTRSLFLPLFFLCLFIVPLTANAENIKQAQIGTIIEIEGTGTLSSTKETYNNDLMNIDLSPEKFGLPVYLNDTIKTGPNSRVLVLFIDDTQITLGENASLKIDEYIFDPDYTKANAGRFSILQGAFLYVSGLLTKNDDPDVQINTAYGSIGIRGTKLWGGMVDDEYGILVEEGQVSVQTATGRIQVKSGLGTTIRSPRAIPSRPQIWASDRINQARKRIALQNKETVMRRIASKKEKHDVLRAKHKEHLKARFQKLKENKKNDGSRYQKKKTNNSYEQYKEKAPVAPAMRQKKQESGHKAIQQKRTPPKTVPPSTGRKTRPQR